MTDTIAFTHGVPPPEAFPTDELGECFDAAIRNDTAVVLQYGQQPGYAPLRRELAEEYGVSGTQGSQARDGASVLIQYRDTHQEKLEEPTQRRSWLYRFFFGP
jgi:hypothetical protein